MEKVHLGSDEKKASNQASRDLFESFASSGALANAPSIAPNMLLPVWYSKKDHPEAVELFHSVERLHWGEPDLPELMAPYEGNTKYLTLLDPARDIAIHGFRMCFPFGRSEADLEGGLVGLPVVDDLIQGSHLVNGKREKLTAQALSDFYKGIKLSDRPVGINFPEDSATIESTFRIFHPEVESDSPTKEYVIAPILFGYIELTKRSTDDKVRALMTYINRATRENLASYSIGVSYIMDDPTMPAVDRDVDGSIRGRLDGYEAVVIIWDEANRAVLGPAAEIIPATLDLTGEMVVKPRVAA